MLSFSQIQSQGIIPPIEPKVALFGARVNTKGSYVHPSGQDPDTTASDMHGLYVDDNPPHMIPLEEFMRDRQSCTMSLWEMIW